MRANSRIGSQVSQPQGRKRGPERGNLCKAPAAGMTLPNAGTETFRLEAFRLFAGPMLILRCIKTPS